MPPTQSEEVNVLSTELSTDYSIPLPSAAQAVGGLTDQRPYHFLALWGNVFLPYLYLQYLSLEREVLIAYCQSPAGSKKTRQNPLQYGTSLPFCVNLDSNTDGWYGIQ